MTTMLYKHPGPHEIHGGKFNYIIVDDGKIDAAIADGWAMTTTEALGATEADPVGQPEPAKRGRPRKIEG